MDGIGGCRKSDRFRDRQVSRCSFVAALCMLALAAAAASSAAAEEAAAANGTREVAADATTATGASTTALPAIKKPPIVASGRWLGQPTSMTAVKNVTLSDLPSCSPHHVQPPNWFGQRNTYIDVTESGCSLIVGDPTESGSEKVAHRPPLTALWLYDDRNPIPTRQQLREDGRHRCSATVSPLLPSPQSAGSDDPWPSLVPDSEPSSFAQVTEAAGQSGPRRRLNRTRSGGDQTMVVRSFRVRNRTQSQIHVWTSSAVRIDLRGACEPQVLAPHFRRNSTDRGRGSLRLSLSYYPETKCICHDREDATAAAMSRQPLPTDALFANDRRFQSLLPERLRCKGRIDYTAQVRAIYIFVRSVPHPESCRRLCVAGICGSELKDLVLNGYPAGGGGVPVRYESLKRGSTDQRMTGTTTSAGAQVPPGPEKDDDKRENDEGSEDPDADDDDADVIGKSDASTVGNVTQAVATKCRDDVYSGFVLLLSPGGKAYLLP